MNKKLKEGDYLFDGFCERPFNPEIDGWRNQGPDAKDYLCVSMAESVLDLFSDLRDARVRIWELEKRLSIYEGKKP